MTDQTATEATDRADLRQRIAKAIDQGEVDAVLEVIRPELAEREARITYWQACRDNYAEENRRLIAQRNALREEVVAARKYAGEMRGFCSPHGVSVGYADQLEAAMDRAKEAKA